MADAEQSVDRFADTDARRGSEALKARFRRMTLELNLDCGRRPLRCGRGSESVVRAERASVFLVDLMLPGNIRVGDG